MYFKFFSIALIICTLSQVNSAVRLSHCHECQKLALCPNVSSELINESLSIDINNEKISNKFFSILFIPIKNVYILITSCEDNAQYIETWQEKEYAKSVKAMKVNFNNMIVFTKYENNCMTIGDIRKKAKEIANKANAMNSGANVLQINMTVEIDKNTYGLRSIGGGEYQMLEKCDKRAEVKLSLPTPEIAQKKMDEIVQSSIATFQIQLGTKQCETIATIGAKIKKHFSALYPKKTTEINGITLPTLTDSTSKAVIKYNYEYFSADKCDSDRSMKVWENAETDIKKWADNLAEQITTAIR